MADRDPEQQHRNVIDKMEEARKKEQQRAKEIEHKMKEKQDR